MVVSYQLSVWIARLETGQTIQPSEFEPKADGKYTHNKALWRGTHFICADADNIKGVDFDDDGNDLNSNGVEGWTEPNALSNRYPELVDTVYAVGESVDPDVHRIEETHVEKAIVLANFTVDCTKRIFENFATTVNKQIEDKIIKCLRRKPNQTLSQIVNWTRCQLPKPKDLGLLRDH